jgi:NitT/TauT family transport system ATP-binding protein
MIRFEHVQKGFPVTGDVVTDLSFEVPSGEFVVFLGPSGCGKSTILRLIAGLEKASLGQIVVRSRKIGFVFQDASLMPWRTVLQNILLPLEIQNAATSSHQGEALALLADVGLADSAHKLPSQLSGGMKMRVSLARALITRPDILLLDEPFAALDEITRTQIGLEVRAMVERLGITTIFVTHSMNEAIMLGDRAFVLSARPARVTGIMDLRRSSPRSNADRADLKFGERLAQLHQLFEKSYEGIL